MTPTGTFSDLPPELQPISAMNAEQVQLLRTMKNPRLHPGIHQPVQSSVQSGWQTISGSLWHEPGTGLGCADRQSSLSFV